MTYNNSSKKTFSLNHDIKLHKSDFNFKIINKSKVNLNLCWQCYTCSLGCPFSHAMDLLPNQVIRLVQLGEKKDVLESSAIWLCVGCYTCTMGCPMAIDMPSIMTALRETALDENVKVAETDIYSFHKEFLNSVKQYGRAHKLGIMLRYKIKKNQLFEDVVVGFKMFIKRKLNLLPSKVKNIVAIRKIFK